MTQAPSYPSENTTFGNLHMGNVHDDDPQIIDNDNLEVDAPPDVTAAVGTQDSIPVVFPTKLARLLTEWQTIDPAWFTPTLLMPGDGNRNGLIIRVFSPTAVLTDYILIADDAGKISSTPATRSMGAKVYHGQSIEIDDYTGPIYVSALGSSALVSVTYVATTS